MGDAYLHVLLIESDDGLAARVRGVLGGSGAPPCRLQRSHSLAEGLEQLAAAARDLVLVDLELQDARGFEVFLRTLAARPATQVAALAAEAEQALAERVLRAGARDVLFLEQLERGALGRLLRDIAAHRAARREAERSEANYRAIFDAVNDAILVLGLEADQIVDVNNPGLLMFGYPRDQLLRLRVDQLGSGEPPYTAARLLAHLQRAALGEAQIFEWQARRADGSLFWVELNLKLARVGDQERLLAAVRDITARRNAENENLRLAAFPRESPYPILECDANAAVIYLNPATRRLLDASGAELGRLLPANHVEIVRACLADGDRIDDIETRLAERVFAWTYQPVPAVGVVHLHALDITERKRAEERLQKNALQDVLTGLPNRALLMDRLERDVDLMQRHEDYRFAVLLLDLDRFKLVNESLGHDGGDRLLREVTERLYSCVQPSDTVARTGGDEFVLVLEDIGSPANVTRVADRIHRELARPFVLDGREMFVSASIGIVANESGAAAPERLLQEAETAMYRAKSEGRGRYTVFDQAQHQRGAAQFQLENELRQGLERGELVTFYQPVVAVQSGQITGFEALVRWQHPDRGLLAPGAFIGLAEETGLIEPMSEQVIETACRQVRAWHEQGHAGLQASVNLSGLQFRRHDLAGRVLAVLDRSGLDPRWLKVEVTESVAAGDAEYAIATLNRLREVGVGVMIDDFGTGYSSLSYLKRLPIDFLKIDRSFVMDVTRDTGSEAIVITVILLAHALGFEVVGEGVETTAQRDMLRRHNCDFAQGYLYSRPVPADEFGRLLARGALEQPAAPAGAPGP